MHNLHIPDDGRVILSLQVLLGAVTWSWSYCSWIYIYLCNQCPSPLKWVWVPFIIRCTRYNICNNLSETCESLWISTVSSTNKTNGHDIPRNWNIVESGVKYHKLTHPEHLLLLFFVNVSCLYIRYLSVIIEIVWHSTFQKWSLLSLILTGFLLLLCILMKIFLTNNIISLSINCQNIISILYTLIFASF